MASELSGEPANSVSGRAFYSAAQWDETDWVDIIAVEYRSLIAAYPFETLLRSLRSAGNIRLLDIGCGTAIFPAFLDQVLADDLHLTCDLVDISPVSLEKARRTLSTLQHFSPRDSLQTTIEDLPGQSAASSRRYDLIWAIHSLTTVDVEQIPRVFRWMLAHLSGSGYAMIYQLTGRSSYQRLHRFFRDNDHRGADPDPFMTYEDSARILRALGVRHQVTPFSFDHVIPDDNPVKLDAYLRKCVLQPDIDALQVFAPLLAEFHDSARRIYRFPQNVNLVTFQGSPP